MNDLDRAVLVLLQHGLVTGPENDITAQYEQKDN